MNFFIALVLALAAAETQVPNADNQPAVYHEKTEDLAYKIGSKMRCPVCQGMPIAESPAEMAVAMMKRVREMVDEGKEEPEIITYFTDRYGEWVLLQPKAEGINWLVWLLPPGALIGIFLVAIFRQRQRAALNTDAAPLAAHKPSPNKDAYDAAIERELER